ncbi:MAG: SRPBCC domain-containing protein [Chitinophagaceae bacterium]
MEATSKTPAQAEPAGRQIVIERVFHLPLNKVWQAWTHPESFKRWWGPEDYTCPSSSMDFRTGGKYLHCMRSPGGEETWSTGIFKEIDPYKKLVFTDSFSDNKGNLIPASAMNMPGEWPLELLVIVHFRDQYPNTKILLQHEGIPSEMQPDCITGWNESFDKLEKNTG